MSETIIGSEAPFRVLGLLEDEDGVTRNQVLIGGGVGIAAVAIGLGAYYLLREPPLADEFISHSRDDLSEKDPLSQTWRRIPGYKVELQPQAVTQPIPEERSVSELIVKSMHDDSRIAFHIRWEDDTKNEREAMARFRDAVALQLPVNDKNPPVAFMGAKGSAVNIFHWKASWQKDIDDGFQDVADSFPNIFEDVTPEKIMEGDTSVQFYPGRVVGNSLSDQDKSSPIEELVAEGFGSTTTDESMDSDGKGVYEDGKWFAVISFPMERGEDRARVEPGSNKNVAFAVWDGAHQEVGARKHWANWQSLEVEEA